MNVYVYVCMYVSKILVKIYKAIMRTVGKGGQNILALLLHIKVTADAYIKEGNCAMTCSHFYTKAWYNNDNKLFLHP